MTSPEVPSLEQRLATLERRYRRARLIGCVLAGVAALPYLTAARGDKTSRVDVLRTERIDLVRGDSVMVSLTVAPPRLKRGLAILNRDGKVNAAVLLDEDGGNFHVFSNAESSLASLYVDGDGGGLAVRNKNGKRNAWIFSRPEQSGGGGALRIYNGTGGTAAEAWGDSLQGGEFFVLGRNGKLAAGMFARSDSAGGEVNVYNQTGANVAAVYARPDNAGGEIDVSNRTGRDMAQIYSRSDTAGGEFNLYNQAGKAIVELFARADGAGGDFQILNGTGHIVSELYSQPSQGGALNVYDPGGTEVGTLFARTDGAGADLQIFSGAGTRVVSLFSSSNREGRLQLYDGSGVLKHSVP